MDQGDVRFQACAPLGTLRQLVQEPLRVRSLPGPCVGTSEISQGVRARSRQGPRLLEFGDCVLEEPLLFQGAAEIEMGRGEARVQKEGLSVLRHRLIEFPRVEEGVPQIRVDDERDRIQLQGPIRLGNRLLAAAHVPEEDGIPMVSRREARLQLDGPLELGLRPRPIPIVEELHAPQRSMRLSEMLVDLQRFERSGPRPGVALLG